MLEQAPESAVLNVVPDRHQADEAQPNDITQWLDWLSDEYDLTTAALNDLGFSEGDDIPALEQVRDTLLENYHVDWLMSRVNDQDELLLPPRAQDVGLRGSRHEPGLMRRYDAKQRWLLKSHVGSALQQFDDQGPLHDNYATRAFLPGVLLGDATDNPLELSAAEGPDGDAEYGLVYTNMSANQQRMLFSRERWLHATQGRQLRLATVPDFILLAAKRRLAGRPRPQRRTAFTHYPDINTSLCVGNAQSGESRTIPLKAVPDAVAPAMGGGALLLEDNSYGLRETGIRRVLQPVAQLAEDHRQNSD